MEYGSRAVRWDLKVGGHVRDCRSTTQYCVNYPSPALSQSFHFSAFSRVSRRSQVTRCLHVASTSLSQNVWSSMCCLFWESCIPMAPRPVLYLDSRGSVNRMCASPTPSCHRYGSSSPPVRHLSKAHAYPPANTDTATNRAGQEPHLPDQASCMTPNGCA